MAQRDSYRGGSTALVQLTLGNVLFAAHAGDTRAVACVKGAAVRLTEDHKPNLPAEKSRVLAAGGRVRGLYVPRVARCTVPSQQLH